MELGRQEGDNKEPVNIYQYYGTLYNNKVRAIKLEESH